MWVLLLCGVWELSVLRLSRMLYRPTCGGTAWRPFSGEGRSALRNIVGTSFLACATTDVLIYRRSNGS